VRQAKLRHTITRHRITLEDYQAAAEGARFRRMPGAVWKSLREMRNLAFAAVHRKILERLAAAGTTSRFLQRGLGIFCRP
jgi:hypothetical protein